MSTGQYPRQRETDAEAKERVKGLEQRRRDHLAGAYRIPGHVFRFLMPRIGPSGQLMRP